MTLICNCGKTTRSGTVIKTCAAHVQLNLAPPDQLRAMSTTLGPPVAVRKAADQWNKRYKKSGSRKRRGTI